MVEAIRRDGGITSREFMCMTDAGEDMVASCEKRGLRANLEKATSRSCRGEDSPVMARRRSAHAGMKTIEEVAKFLAFFPHAED